MALICIGTGFHLSGDQQSSSSEQPETSGYGWLVVSAMMAYLLAFGVGMSSVPWTMNAEIYPTHARSFGTSASTTTNWLGNYVVSATFLILASDDRGLGTDGAFWFYAVMGVAGWVWLYRCMPETKGRSLEEVELLFAREGDPPRPGEDSVPQMRPSGFVLLEGDSPNGPVESLLARGGSGRDSASEVHPRELGADASWISSVGSGRNATLT